MKRNRKSGLRIAVYPGSFDPVTNGHIDVIKRAAVLFDALVIAVTTNPAKKSFFSSGERITLIKEALDEAGTKKINGNIKVDSFRGLLVDYMKKTGANVVIRGLRAVSDFEYEFQMALMNRKLNAEVETVFLMTEARFAYLSSSLVREISSFGADVSPFVPVCVLRRIRGNKK